MVVIPVMTQHYAMLQRNLLYTRETRGKRLVVLVGQKKAVVIAVKNVSGRRRWSKLNEWLGTGLRTTHGSLGAVLPDVIGSNCMPWLVNRSEQPQGNDATLIGNRSTNVIALGLPGLLSSCARRVLTTDIPSDK